MGLFRRDNAEPKRELLGYDEFGNPMGNANELTTRKTEND